MQTCKHMTDNNSNLYSHCDIKTKHIQALGHTLKAMLTADITTHSWCSCNRFNFRCWGKLWSPSTGHTSLLHSVSIYCNMCRHAAAAKHRWMAVGAEGVNHTSGCHGSGYLVCQCESGLGERPETLHLKLHLTDRRVKADAATTIQTNVFF